MPGQDFGQKRHQGHVMTSNGVKVFVGVAEIRATGQLVGKVEFNPSRVVDPEGYGLATVDEAQAAAREAWEAAGELVEWHGPAETSKVRRADVARDFAGIDQPGALIRALAPVHRPWSRRNLVHADPSRHGAQTLMVGSGAGVVRLYDKEAESKGKAPAGTVRWEAECRSEWNAKYGDIATLMDLDEARVRKLARNRWEWSAMGVEVAGTKRIVAKVRRSDLTEREQAQFLGWLLMRAAGDAWEPGSGHTLAKYRRLQRELGIALDDVDQGEGVVTHLDFETGRELARVA